MATWPHNRCEVGARAIFCWFGTDDRRYLVSRRNTTVRSEAGARAGMMLRPTFGPRDCIAWLLEGW